MPRRSVVVGFLAVQDKDGHEDSLCSLGRLLDALGGLVDAHQGRLTRELEIAIAIDSHVVFEVVLVDAVFIGRFLAKIQTDRLAELRGFGAGFLRADDSCLLYTSPSPRDRG